MGMNMLRAGVIAQRIDISQVQYPGVLAAALFIVSPAIGMLSCAESLSSEAQIELL